MSERLYVHYDLHIIGELSQSESANMLRRDRA